MPDASAVGAVGFWGLGNMGIPMSARLLEAGIPVLGFDPSPEARDRFLAHGGTVVDGPEPLADARAVILMLPNSDVVEQVVRQGMADVLRPGTPIIDMSSSEPLRTQSLAAALAERGTPFVDAPVSGGVTGAERGTLAIMVGGSEADVVTVTPLLEVFGSPRHVGPSGAGHALKALNNLLSATHLWATSEAMLVGQRFGLDPQVMLEAINGSSGRSGSTQNKWPNFILPGGYDSGFGLRLMVKDMRIASELGRELGVPMELGDAALAHWAHAAEELPSTADHTEVARLLADESRATSAEPTA
jgi:3-hydroxyisobutyrate dehydrogenase